MQRDQLSDRKKKIYQWEQNVCSVWMKQNLRNYGDEEKNKAWTCCRVTMPKEKEMSFWHMCKDCFVN